MASFKSYFRHLYATFGYPLTHRHGLSSDALTAVGRRLAVRIPAALRDYCLIAGRERRFNTSHNRILPPREWKIDKRRLLFMDETRWSFDGASRFGTLVPIIRRSRRASMASPSPGTPNTGNVPCSLP